MVRLIQSNESSPRSSCGLVSGDSGLGAKRSSSQRQTSASSPEFEQRLVARGELGSRRPGGGSRLGALEDRAELVAAQLADLGTGQGFGGDREIAERW